MLSLHLVRSLLLEQGFKEPHGSLQFFCRGVPFIHAADHLPGAVGIKTPAAIFSQNDGPLFAGSSFNGFRKAVADFCTSIQEEHPLVLREVLFQKLLYGFIELSKVNSRCKANQIVGRQVCHLLFRGVDQMDAILICNGLPLRNMSVA